MKINKLVEMSQDPEAWSELVVVSQPPDWRERNSEDVEYICAGR